MPEIVAAAYSDHERAHEAVQALIAEGFQNEDISLITADPGEAEGLAEETGATVLNSTATGALTGGALGAVFGVLGGIGAIAMPGLVVLGPLGAALLGLTTMGTFGGIMGLLAGLGVPDTAAEEMNRLVNEGHSVLLVQAEDRQIEAEAVLARTGGTGIHHFTSEHPLPSHQAAADAREEVAERPVLGVGIDASAEPRVTGTDTPAGDLRRTADLPMDPGMAVGASNTVPRWNSETGEAPVKTPDEPLSRRAPHAVLDQEDAADAFKS